MSSHVHGVGSGGGPPGSTIGGTYLNGNPKLVCTFPSSSSPSPSLGPGGGAHSAEKLYPVSGGDGDGIVGLLIQPSRFGSPMFRSPNMNVPDVPSVTSVSRTCRRAVGPE